ncbi:MAG: M48 family metalloprotease [Firmicutes bacterium]|nr:M48 family metalloprotease [Bacillota bacterium]
MRSQNNNRIGLGIFLSLVITAVIFIPVAILNTNDNLLFLETTLLGVLFYSIALLVSMSIVNLAVYLRRSSKAKKAKLIAMWQKLLKDRSELNDPQKISHSVKSHKQLCVFLMSIFLVTIILGLIASIFLIFINAWFIIVGVFFPILLSCFIIRALPKKRISTLRNPTYLSIIQYPTIHNAVTTASKMMGVYKDYELHLGSGANVVSITEHNKGYLILIGKDALRMLNETELTAVMLHEFAHAMHGELKFGNRITKLVEFCQGKTLMRLFMGQVFSMLNYVVEEFALVRSKMLEEDADRVLLEKGLQQELINALAKLTLFDLGADALPLKNLFEDEASPKNIPEFTFNRFLELYNKNKDIWHHMCKTELPHRFSTHPTCSERMKNLGVGEFTVDFSLNDNAYSKEVQIAFKIAHNLLSSSDEDWIAQRKDGYLTHLEVIERFENQEGNIDLYAVCESYFALCNYEKALEIAEQILKENPKNAFALHKKGVLLCEKYDDNGLEYLQESADVHIQYLPSVIEIMGKYVTYGALEQKRLELRVWGDSKLEEMYSFYKHMALSEYKDLVKHDLSRSTTDRISEILKKEGVLSCYIFKDKKTATSAYFVLIEPSVKSGMDHHDKLMQRLFNALSILNETFYVFDFRQENKLHKKSRAMAEAKIYVDEHSIINVPVDKKGFATRKKRNANKIMLYYAIACLISILPMLFILVITLLAVFINFDNIDYNIGILIVPASIPPLIVVLVFVKTALSKDKKLYTSGKFKRTTFEFSVLYAEEYLKLFIGYFENTAFRSIPRPLSNEPLEGGVEQLAYSMQWPSNKNEKYKAYLCFNIKLKDNTFTVESFIMVTDSRVTFEMGLYGFYFSHTKKVMRNWTRAVLNFLNAPVTINV